MNLTINKFVPETIDIDISKPIFRIRHESIYYRLTALNEKDTEVLIVSEKSFTIIKNYSETVELIQCERNFSECSEEEFKYALWALS